MRRYKRASDASALKLQLTVHVCQHGHMEHNGWHVSRHKSVAHDMGNSANSFWQRSVAAQSRAEMVPEAPQKINTLAMLDDITPSSNCAKTPYYRTA